MTGKIGRPTLPDDVRRDENLRMRIAASLRSRLEDAASSIGSTLSDEVIRRLEASFDNEVLRRIVREEVRGGAEGDPKLADPVAVHINMLYGRIAKPSLEGIIHLYGRDALLKALGNP